MARPSPEPGGLLSARTPRCSTVSLMSAASPGPSSSTVMTTPIAGADRLDDHASLAPTCTRCRAGCRASRRDPPAGRARQSRRAHACRWRDGGPHADAASSEPALRRFLNDGSRSRPGARRGGARVGEVIVDLPAHSLDLLADRRGELALAGGAGAFGLARQQRQRRLETVREVAGLRNRALHRLLALFDQRVQVVDERLHLGGIVALRPARRVPRARGRGASRSCVMPASPRRTCMRRQATRWQRSDDEDGMRGPR